MTGRTAASTDAAAPWWKRVVVVLGILGMFGATVLFLLTRTGGTLLGDTTTHVVANQLLAQMVDGDEVIQSVRASDDRLSAVEIRFGTYLGAADCTLRVTLREGDHRVTEATGTVLASRDWECAALPDSSPLEALDLPPVENSAGQVFDVVVQRIDGRDTPGAVLWAGNPGNDARPAAVNGTVTALSADIRPLYDPQPRWWNQLDVILSRMAAFGPAWGTAGAFGFLVLTLAGLLAVMPLALRSPRTLLVIVALLALVRGLLWSAAVPTFGGMDEPAHFSNVQYLVEAHALPGQADNPGTYSEQVNVAHDNLHLTSSPPGDRPDYSPAAEDHTSEVIEEASSLGGGGGPAAAYPPVYYIPAAVFAAASGDSFFGQVMAARLWSVLLGVAAAVLMLLIGRRTFPGRPGSQTAFAAAGVLHPMLSHQFAIVNNDAWVIVAGFGGLLVALELARRPRARLLALTAGVAIGCALLGKPFGVAVAVPLAIGWLIGKVRGRVRSPSALGLEAGLVVLGFAMTYGLWRVIAVIVGIPSQKVPVIDSVAPSLHAFLAAQRDGVKWIWASQLWGNFGWVRIPFPEPITTVIFAGLVAIAIGVAVWLVLVVAEALRRRRVGRRMTERGAGDGDAEAATEPASVAVTEAEAGIDPPEELSVDARILLHASLLVAMVITLYAAAWVYYTSTGQNDLLQGRYALLALPAILALPGLLLERFSRGRLSPLLVNASLAVAMGGLTLLGLKRVLESFYG